MNRKTIALIIGTALCAMCASQATQIAYEGFDYPNGTTMYGQNGGAGWMAAWQGPLGSGADFVVTNGLSYTNETGGFIAGIGGAIFDHDSSSHEEFRQWFDPSVPDMSVTYGTNLWFSFIATYDTASGSGGGINLFEDGANNTEGFGAVILGPAGGGQFAVQLRVGPLGQAPSPTAFAGFGLVGSPVTQLTSCTPGKNLVVGRIQLAAGETGPSGALVPYTGNDRIDVWLNPTTEPVGNSQLWFKGFYAQRNTGYSLGLFGIRTGGGCQATIDEVRIGTTYSDVVPVTAQTPNLPPSPPQLTMNPAGPVGLQINQSEATPTNTCEIVSYYETNNAVGGNVAIDAKWLGQTPASYSFTIAQPPAKGPTNFMAFVWLIPGLNPGANGHILALDNANAVQLALISDGNGGAKAVLGYYVNNSGGNFYANAQTLFTSPAVGGVGGVICSIPSAPFGGTWTIAANSDASFTITAPNGASASGSMISGDQANFTSVVSFYLGVSPNGGSNVGTPALGNYMTVGGITITNNSGTTINTNWGPGVVIKSDFTTGAPLSALNPPNWSVFANFPSCIYVMPANSLYRAEWATSCSTSAGQSSLLNTNALGGGGIWPNSIPITSVLSDSTNITFVTTQYGTNAAGFFRVDIPYYP